MIDITISGRAGFGKTSMALVIADVLKQFGVEVTHITDESPEQLKFLSGHRLYCLTGKQATLTEICTRDPIKENGSREIERQELKLYACHLSDGIRNPSTRYCYVATSQGSDHAEDLAWEKYKNEYYGKRRSEVTVIANEVLELQEGTVLDGEYYPAS